ncbi:hypothetical protein F5Y14DRAFT_170967 [Nemania sp. NC0429]|nr:hypothetical protein F5Y14DRAFT_170967 [Nemania sp. NC0429]
MSVSRQSQRQRREVLRPGYGDQYSFTYHPQGIRDNFSNARTSDVHSSRHSSLVHHEGRSGPSPVLGYSSSRSQPDDLTSYRETLTDFAHINMKKPRGYEFTSRDGNPQLQKSRVETMAFSGSSRRQSPDSSGSSRPYTLCDKAVRFDDKAYPDISPPGRFPGTVRHQRDTDGARPMDSLSLVRVPGNRDMNGELLGGGGHRSSLSRRSRADERQRSYVPAAPIIPRLPTPDFDSTSHHELGLAKYDFCPCCTSYNERNEGGGRCKRGRSKMDKQVDHARAYISRVTMSERLITDA